jgi:hypothetical protein
MPRDAVRGKSRGQLPEDPCAVSEITARAHAAAVMQLAAVAPKATQLLTRLEAASGQRGAVWVGLETFDSRTGASQTPVQEKRRLINRWPSAFALTRLSCRYDPRQALVTVRVSYLRLLQMPLISPMVAGLYRVLATLQGEEPYPGLQQLPAAKERDVAAVVLQQEVKTIASGGEVKSRIAAQAELMTSLVAAHPASLRALQLVSEVQLKKDTPHSRRPSSAADPFIASRWEGSIKGILETKGAGNPYPSWMRNLSQMQPDAASAREVTTYISDQEPPLAAAEPLIIKQRK